MNVPHRVESVYTDSLLTNIQIVYLLLLINECAVTYRATQGLYTSYSSLALTEIAGAGLHRNKPKCWLWELSTRKWVRLSLATVLLTARCGLF